MAQTAKDFIRKRTLDDVFPPLVNYLRKLQVHLKKILANEFHSRNEMSGMLFYVTRQPS